MSVYQSYTPVKLVFYQVQTTPFSSFLFIDLGAGIIHIHAIIHVTEA